MSGAKEYGKVSKLRKLTLKQGTAKKPEDLIRGGVKRIR